jgi:hypothetical protein
MFETTDFLPTNSTLEIKLAGKNEFIVIDEIKDWSSEMAANVDQKNYTNVEQIRINLAKPQSSRWLLLSELKFF